MDASNSTIFEHPKQLRNEIIELLKESIIALIVPEVV